VIALKRARVLGALALSFGLVAAACSSDGGDAEVSSGDTAASETTDGAERADNATAGGGGTITLGAEQEPDCMDWIASCAGASWGAWTTLYHTMPRSFDFEMVDGDWAYVPSPLLAGDPEVTEDPQTVTYKLNPEAVWSDGTQITCADFEYTWDQIATGEDIYDPTGYVDISGIEAKDDTTCVATFSKPYAGWRSLFTGLYGVLPSHLLDGKDRSALMKDGYEFSGGPFMLKEWKKGDSITLVPNENYWGSKAKPDEVVWKFVPDTSAYFAAFKAGEVLAIYPQPQIDAIEEINAGLSGAREPLVTARTGNLEALWMNNNAFPFDSVPVRQAFAYSLDRDAVVKRLFGGIGVDKAVQSLNAPIVGKLADQEAFAGYTKDLDKVDELMTGDGWAKNANGVWEKGGKTATIEFKTTAGNKRRELTQQVVQEQAKAAGFEVTINNQKAGDLFGQQLPAGDFQLALYAQVLTNLEPGPSSCSIFCSKNIPSDANGNAGQNWTRTDIPELDTQLELIDTSVDVTKRGAATKAADKLEAENMVSLPLDPLPTIGLVSEKIQAPEISDNAILSVFWNLADWSVN